MHREHKAPAKDSLWIDSSNGTIWRFDKTVDFMFGNARVFDHEFIRVSDGPIGLKRRIPANKWPSPHLTEKKDA